MDLSEHPYIEGPTLATEGAEKIVDAFKDIERCASPPVLRYSTSDKPCLSETDRTQHALGASEPDPQVAKSKVSLDDKKHIPLETASPPISFQHEDSTILNSESLPTPSPSNTWGALSGDSTCYSSSTRSFSSETNTSKKSSIMQRFFDRAWIQPAIGLTTLLITLIALFVYSHRSFVMAKWTEENDMLQACAQLIQDRPNITYPQCESMIAVGPKPPPYIEEDMYHPGIRTRNSDAQASTMIIRKRRPSTLSSLANESAQTDIYKLEKPQGKDSHVQAYFSVDIVILVLCAISTTLAIARICWMIAYSWYEGREASLTISTGQVMIEIFRLFRTFRRGTNRKFMEQRLSVESRQAGSVRVLKKIRRRLHHHHCGDIVHELLCSDRNLLGHNLYQPMESTASSIAVTSGLST